MVVNISGKVRSFIRDISVKTKEPGTASALPIKVVSTYGANGPLVKILEKFEGRLKESFSSVGPQQKFFSYTYRMAPKLGGLLSSTKQLMLDNGPGATEPCGSRRCETCPLVSNSDTIVVNGKTVVPRCGSCISRNIIYLVLCSLCSKGYIGKTTNTLRCRVNGHRAIHRKVISSNGASIQLVRTNHQDDLSLGYHLFKEHGSSLSTDFNNYFKFSIVQHCSPNLLDVTEHKWIHRLHTLEPGGINSMNPFAIPLAR